MSACPRCNASLGIDAKFCSSCGWRPEGHFHDVEMIEERQLGWWSRRKAWEKGLFVAVIVAIAAVMVVIFSLGCTSSDPGGDDRLQGSSWVLIGLSDGGDGMVPVLADTRISITFDEGGGFAGLAGCNSYWGTYTSEGERLSIGSLEATKMACLEPPGIMEQETAYLKALQEADTSNISGETLELRRADGTLLASYEPELYEVLKPG